MEIDPYRSPGANVSVQLPDRRSVWWKIYFYFIGGMTLSSIAFMFTQPEIGLPDYIGMAFWLVAPVGLYGFVFFKRILTPDFWRYFLIVYIVFNIAYYFLTDVDLSGGMTQTWFIFSIIVSWLMSFPTLFGIYLYSKWPKLPPAIST